ncbi:MAG TPA: hypothetical protein VFP55_08350 [Solirubrobacteraceae bacterium]|nr:hypothetical protein [Solirubrobacteraceae bacterium]
MRALRGLVPVLMLVIAFVIAAPARAADPFCTAGYGGRPARPGPRLRFGIDPGVAGSAGGVQLASTPDDLARDEAAVQALRPRGRLLVVRLNRLFWSDGEAGISHFQSLVSRYAGAGFEVELQVRYHPTQAENGDIAAWAQWVRHVVDVFGPDRRVVDMTITNEVNLNVSPNTSDGSYKNARNALIEGIEAAHDEALRHRFGQLRFGFTYAYRWDPQSDAAFFTYLRTAGGKAFQQALGFVGVDFYPGSFYPPTLAGTTYAGATDQALGTVRDCFLPMAGIGPGTPLWLTETGVPTGATESPAAQSEALSQIVRAAAAVSGTYGLTDLRWFDLRDANSTPTGSLPAASLTFATDGLLTADYAPKPAFATYRGLIAALGARAPVLRRHRVHRRARHRRRRHG